MQAFSGGEATGSCALSLPPGRRELSLLSLCQASLGFLPGACRTLTSRRSLRIFPPLR